MEKIDQLQQHFEVELTRQITVAVEANNREEAESLAEEYVDDDWFGSWYEGDTQATYSRHITPHQFRIREYKIQQEE